MSSSGIDPVNSGPLILRTYLDGTSNNTYVLSTFDNPVPSNRVLTTSSFGEVVPSDNITISSLTVSSLISNGVTISQLNNLNIPGIPGSGGAGVIIMSTFIPNSVYSFNAPTIISTNGSGAVGEVNAYILDTPTGNKFQTLFTYINSATTLELSNTIFVPTSTIARLFVVNNTTNSVSSLFSTPQIIKLY